MLFAVEAFVEVFQDAFEPDIVGIVHVAQVLMRLDHVDNSFHFAYVVLADALKVGGAEGRVGRLALTANIDEMRKPECLKKAGTLLVRVDDGHLRIAVTLLAQADTGEDTHERRVHRAAIVQVEDELIVISCVLLGQTFGELLQFDTVCETAAPEDPDDDDAIGQLGKHN